MTATSKTTQTLRILLASAGIAMLTYGAWGILHGAHETALESIGRWLLYGLLLHDAVLAPLVFSIGYVAYRITGPRLRRSLAAILLIAGSAVVITLPELLLPAGNTNPTVHPLNYARDLTIVVGSVIAAAALYVLFATRHERAVARRHALAQARQTPTPPAPAPTHTLDPTPSQSLQSDEAAPPSPTPEPIPSADA